MPGHEDNPLALDPASSLPDGVPNVLNGARLFNADLRGADFSGRDMMKIDLRNADLTGADLQDANLTGALLTGAVLTRADLRGAILDHAELTRAQMSGADLDSASLVEADLTGADLTRANLRLADLTGAKLKNTQLAGADLAAVAWDLSEHATVSVFHARNAVHLMTGNALQEIANTIGLATYQEQIEPAIEHARTLGMTATAPGTKYAPPSISWG